jgi:hypothetical protein
MFGEKKMAIPVIDIKAIHETLLKVNTRYRENVEQLAINRQEALVPEVNAEIDNALREAGRKFELFMGEVSYLAILPFGEELIKTVEDPDNDFMFAVFTDTGLHLLGNKAGFVLGWNEIKYIIVGEDSSVFVELFDSSTLIFGDAHMPTILTELALSYNKNYPETFRVLQDVKE